MDASSATDSPSPNSPGGDRGHLAIRCNGLHSKMNAQRSEAWLTLQEKFFDQIAQPPLNPCRVWRLFVTDEWYQAVLTGCVKGLLRRQHVPGEWFEDLRHEAMLVFAEQLQRRPDLHFDPGRPRHTFPAWVYRIVLNTCRKALAQFRRVHPRALDISDCELAAPAALGMERRLDLAQAIDQLRFPVRIVMGLLSAGLSTTDVAERLSMSYWQVCRFRGEGIASLRAKLACDVYSTDRGPVRKSG